MPVRKIPKNYRNLTGSVVNSADRGLSDFESTLERDLYILLDFSTRVSRFEEQPLTIEYWDGLTTRRYTPDVLIHYLPTGTRPENIKKPELCEVKYRGDIKEIWPECKNKYRAAIRFAKNRGWRFRLITEVEIRGAKLANANFLRRYKRAKINKKLNDNLFEKVKKAGVVTPIELLEEYIDTPQIYAQYLAALWQMIAKRSLNCDLSVSLTMNSQIQLAQKELIYYE